MGGALEPEKRPKYALEMLTFRTEIARNEHIRLPSVTFEHAWLMFVFVKFWVSVNREPKCYTETKLRAHVLVNFSQILVIKSDNDFGSVNEAYSE